MHPAGIRTRDLPITSPTPYTTTLPSQPNEPTCCSSSSLHGFRDIVYPAFPRASTWSYMVYGVNSTNAVQFTLQSSCSRPNTSVVKIVLQSKITVECRTFDASSSLLLSVIGVLRPRNYSSSFVYNSRDFYQIWTSSRVTCKQTDRRTTVMANAAFWSGVPHYRLLV